MSIPAATSRRSGPDFWVLLTWAALDAAVAIYLRAYGVSAVSSALLVMSLAVGAVAVARSRGPATGVTGPAVILLVAHIAVLIPGPYRPDIPVPPAALQLIPVAALVAVLAGLAGTWWARRGGRAGDASLRAGLAVAVVAGIAFRAAIVAFDSPPTFDVPLIQVEAGQALLNGTNPYLTFVYDSGYPYLPFAAIAAAAGELFGDARWAGVVGDILTVGGILLLARRVRTDGTLALVLAGLWAWWSGFGYVTWQGFPEPILIGLASVGAALLAGPEPRARAAGVLLGLAAATKQFGMGLFPLLLLPWRAGRTAFVVGVGTWLILVVPFAVWDPQAFLEGAFLSHVFEPGREYALNILNWPGINLEVPTWVALSAGFVAGAATSTRYVEPATRWVAGSAALLLVAFVLIRIAFVNYYAIPLAFLLLLLVHLHGTSSKDLTDVPTDVHSTVR